MINNISDYHGRKSRIFFDIEEWNNFYQAENIGFAFGTRFHGNMCALRNGIPSVWITHDTRTRELTEFLHLPKIDINEFAKMKYIEEIFDACDYSETQKFYKRLLDNYISYLDENNISHCFKL